MKKPPQKLAMASKAKPRKTRAPRKPRLGQIPCFDPLTEEALQSHTASPHEHSWIFVAKHYERRLDPRLVQLCEYMLLNLPREPAPGGDSALYRLTTHHTWQETGLVDDEGQPCGVGFIMHDARRLAFIHSNAQTKFSKILTAAAAAMDFAFFDHLAETMRHVRNERHLKLRDNVWYRFEVAYIVARYTANEMQAPNVDRTTCAMEYEKHRIELIKDCGSGVERFIPSSLPLLPSPPTLGEIERALALPKSPTVADVCLALANPYVTGKSLAEDYARKLSELKTKEPLERRVRDNCKDLKLPLQ